MMMRVEEVILALGGAKAAAELTGVSQPAVSNWKARSKIPAEHFFVISDALERAGKDRPSREIFSPPKPNGEAAA